MLWWISKVTAKRRICYERFWSEQTCPWCRETWLTSFHLRVKHCISGHHKNPLKNEYICPREGLWWKWLRKIWKLMVCSKFNVIWRLHKVFRDYPVISLHFLSLKKCSFNFFYITFTSKQLLSVLLSSSCSVDRSDCQVDAPINSLCFICISMHLTTFMHESQ